MKIKMIRTLCILCIILGTCCLVVAALSAKREQQELSKKLIRLHVIANSNAEEDQTLKLHVRDMILEYLQNYSWQSQQQARNWIAQNTDTISAIGQKAVADCGFNYAVKAEIGMEEYPTRAYDTFMLPAGEYLSLRIVIGEGEGKNWWCVVYPSICLTAVSDLKKEAAAANFTDEQVKFITENSEQIRLKFKLLELLSKLRRFLQDT